MNKENILLLINDAIIQNLFFNPFGETAIFALGFFGKEAFINYFLVYLTAYAAVSVINYSFGKGFYLFYKKYNQNDAVDKRYLWGYNFFQNWGKLFLLFSFVNGIGNIIVLVSGFFKIRLKTVLFFVIMSKTIYIYLELQ